MSPSHPARVWNLISVCLLLLALSGCGFGTRYVFYSSRDVQSTPDRAGMAYEEVWFPSADGVQLHGWYVPAESPGPLVVFFHGNAANITHRVLNLHYLHNLGLPVFIFDYRGYGASQGRPLQERDLYRDAQGALAWLRQRGWSPERMIYFGRSLGAAVALEMALKQPPAGLVLECPFTSLRDIAWEMTPFTYVLVGWWSIDARFDNLAKIARLSRPLLMVHGDRDRVIPHEMSLRLFARAPDPKSLLLVPGAGHSDAHQVGGDSYRTAWINFIDRIYKSKFSHNLTGQQP
ncbi:phospholipase [Desulfuromonas versatilis]|uniref:Phospholipase n=1 Tax=Desulfuromonas versatilis TaxID=2802975 RepID=A0ABN6DSR0_9BACT|nr:alpha/beta hydrolase [Desulfuromonas versatilis]BCR03215.1 phospholipase [Desulfuromonas versatilis]